MQNEEEKYTHKDVNKNLTNDNKNVLKDCEKRHDKESQTET